MSFSRGGAPDLIGHTVLFLRGREEGQLRKVAQGYDNTMSGVITAVGRLRSGDHVPQKVHM